MRVHWSSKALSDLGRLHEFIAQGNRAAAARAVRRVLAGTKRLAAMPRLGEPLPEYAPREIRRMLVDQFEIHYEVTPSQVHIYRIWHTRQQR
jgi:plasmid stabilization system protein ParE